MIHRSTTGCVMSKSACTETTSNQTLRSSEPDAGIYTKFLSSPPDLKSSFTRYNLNRIKPEHHKNVLCVRVPI